MYYPILGMEPIVAFFYLHSILLFTIILLALLSNVKKLAGYKPLFNKTNSLIFLSYVSFHVFCVCIIIVSLFTSISTTFWLILYFKFCIAFGFFAFLLSALAVVLLPFGVLTFFLTLIKDIIKSK